MSMTLEQASNVARRLGLDEHGLSIDSVSGGDTCQATRLRCSDATVFVKSASLQQAGLLSSEADGLQALAESGCVRVPKVLGRGQFEVGEGAWLALEALELRPRDEVADRRLGQQLAALHACTGEQFGWRRNNYIGRMPQSNRPNSDWAVFFREQRLRPQIERLLTRFPERKLAPDAERVLARWSSICADHKPPPALLHGDLWAGNAASLADQQPVVYDPAVHFGDGECDLAMADLFGGFSRTFFAAYEQARPLPEGWQRRRAFYQLYHLLNHANLFAGAYVARVATELARLAR